MHKTKLEFHNFLFRIIGSPGPAAYPGDTSASSKKKYKPKSIYPQDKAHKYSMGIKGYISFT